MNDGVTVSRHGKSLVVHAGEDGFPIFQLVSSPLSLSLSPRFSPAIFGDDEEGKGGKGCWAKKTRGVDEERAKLLLSGDDMGAFLFMSHRIS